MQIIKPILTRKTIGIASIIAAVFLGSLLTYLMLSRPGTTSPPYSTAVIAVIPAPTSTAIPTSTPLPTPTVPSNIPPSPLPGTIGISAYVQITGTGGDGLRLRSDAGLNNPVAFLGLESEVFLVIDGPIDADGYTWWQLESIYDEGLKRQGWAVANYLAPIQNP
jgi:hypothetical protein